MEEQTMALSKSEIEARYVERTGRSVVAYNLMNDSVSYLFFKRAFDLVAGAVGLVLSSPLFLIISLFYLFGSQKGPVFFRQKRIGQRGHAFYIYKFRSMVVNAEEELKSNKLLYRKYIENNYKLEPSEDPRITVIGRFLRKTSLDELPQLINVIKGEMSIVGPRPVVTEELKEYGDNTKLFLSAKPGLTGYWQVCGRSNIEYPERVDVELYYIRHKSFKFDLKIIFQTILSVITGKGAY